MGTDDKLRNAAEEAKGKAKEKAGDAADDRDLQAEGGADQTKADVKEAGEKVEDAFED
ncbi:CsbD family protein [Kribbella sp. NPDC050241]|uniref:CsbD family protein n=1 Tax=Kribbella sp. NPDC050241 TaxID=3364115 RepID=UPI0037A29A74